ncbi:hypothetical protein FPSE_03715 [Fusarium pseudograminearum CS3096]|uniref:Zn(2)-C6 fungal-type domain-containing protein n=1 Tax=Fusarium pseudograminearum (strain CS3096) TaxID=1028729 RepID=K3VQC4_FUSPC|nr:hypothetical protein FPSE_03715 [Fusarium pseudograminearum CS3096]EKJ76083.1 hypothetical protein FPSE_03715 [Fusarium pseudograminearum CS3096]
MGFAGKPSQACEPCRLKRRKCDQKKPQCSPCIRMDIASCEYRSLRVLKIKDETLKVKEKANQRNQGLGNQSERQLKEMRPIRHVVEPIPENIPLPLEATALGYFFSIFSRSGTFAYLPEYSSSLVKDGKITQALSRQYYARSLVQTNQLLSQPETVVLDSTLLCVLLLSAFEALCFHNGGDPENWNAHIRGSSQLLLLRSKTQFQSPFGRLLFHHAGVNVLIDSVVHQTSVSLELNRLFEYATSSSSLLDSVSKSIMFLLWRMAVISPNMKNMTANEVLKETLELHDQLIFSALKRGSGIESSCQYPNTDCIIPEARDFTMEKVLVESAGLVRDILASVPYYLDLLESQNSIEARYLIWPLTSIVSLDRWQRCLINEITYRIGEELPVSQGLSVQDLANFARKGLTSVANNDGEAKSVNIGGAVRHVFKDKLRYQLVLARSRLLDGAVELE